MKRAILITLFLAYFVSASVASDAGNNGKQDYEKVSVGGAFSSYDYIEADGHIYLRCRKGVNGPHGIAYVCPKKDFKGKYKHIDVGGWWSSYYYVKADNHIYLENRSGTNHGHGIAHAGICPCRKKK